MDRMIYLIPALACPLGMGAMMWLMMRSGKADAAMNGPQPQLTARPEGWIDPQQAELAALRAEVDQLRARVGPPIADAVPDTEQDART